MREQWNTRAGFVLATIGSAAGLGNIWRFSYVAGENGGAAFLLIYIICVALLGVPLMLGEFCIGRRAQADAVGAFQSGTSRRSWGRAGWLMAFVSFVVLSYYAVIAGWAYKYLFDYLIGTAYRTESGAISDYFNAFVADPVEPLFWQFVVVALTATVVAAGIKRGIEVVNKILMPLLGLMVIVLAAYALSLDGARAGLAFLFRPDWAALSQPGVYLAALGQAFFSMGIGAGALLTYGSYTTADQKLAPAAVTVATGDTLFAIVAGLAIFPAVFAFGLDPAHGPALAFVTLPEVFNLLPGGRLVAVTFFVLLGMAALTSAVSILEVPCAVLMRHLQWSRTRTAIVVAAAVFVTGVPSALGFGVWREVGLFGMGILQTIDTIASSILLPVGGLLIALFVGWTWSREEALHVAGMYDGRAGRAWLFLLRFIAPCLIVLILLGFAFG